MRKFSNGKKWILLTILILLVTAFAGCGKGENAASEIDVSLSERELVLEIGDSKKLELESETIEVDNLTVSWESSKTSVATVDDDGTVTAVAGGEARVKVIVEYEGKEYTTSCVVTVKIEEKTYSAYKIRWYTQKADRMGYDITEESFEREVGSAVELTAADARKKLPSSNYTFNEEKSILTGTVNESQAGCILEVYFDVAEITYSVDYYYESDVKLGYYMTKETKNYKAYAFTKAAAAEEPKEGFVVNDSVSGTMLSNDSVEAGSTLSVYCDRIRSKVTVDYISGRESKTYTCVYGVGLIDAPKDVFSDSLDLYQVATFVNGEKKEPTEELMKTITADTTVSFKLDGNGFVYANKNGTSTITNNYTAKKTPCYVLLNGESNTIYLSATYTTTGSSSNTFGITLESGGTSREIVFSNQGVAVYKDHTTSGGISSAKDASATYSYAGVYNDGNTFVWAQNSSGYDYTNVVSVVSDMLKNKAGGSYNVCWAVYDGVLYASVEGETVLRLPLIYLEKSWTADKQYTIGLSTYDTNAWGDTLKISNIKPVFGDEAKALLVTDKQFESPLVHHMGYDVFSGAYLTASKSNAGYLYGEEVKGNTGISANIEWADIDNTNSAVGITVKVGDQSVQYVVEGENRSIRSQRNHKWEGINKIGTQIMKEQVPFFSDGKTEVTAFVKDGYFYVMYKGVQVQCINMLSLFPEYTPDTEVSVGICSWDAKNGLAKFTDVKQLSADDVNTIENAKEWGFYSEKLTVDDYSFSDASVSKSQAGRKRAYLFGSSAIWQIEGRINRLDDTTKDLLMGFEISSGDNTILILAHNNGFRKIVNENWADTTISNNVNTVKSTLYAFNNIVSTKLFNSNGSDTRTQTYIDYKAVLYNDTLYVWFTDEDGNEGLCWRVPLTEEEFGSFEKGSVYNVTLYFAETDTDASMTNLDVRMGYQVTEQTDFVEDNSGNQYDFGEAIETIETNINRWDNNFRQKTISGMLAEELGTGVAGHNGAYAYLNGSDTDVFLSATYEMNANVTPGHFGISITDGEEVRSIFYKGYGVFVLQDHAAEYSEIPVIPAGQNHHYFNTGIRPGYVWVYSGTTNAVSEMLTAQDTEHEHEVKWAITDGVLYGMVDDFVFFRIAVSDLCATWDENTKFQIGFEQWYVLNNGDVKNIKDIEVSFGEEALAKMVTDKKLSNVTSAGMTYEVFHGTYLPNSVAGSKYLYGEATNEEQVLEATITQLDKASSTFGCGISLKAGEQSAQIIGYGKVDKVRLIKNYSYGFMFPLRDTVTPITTQWVEAPVFDDNGICKVKAVIKDYTLYLFYNDEPAGSIDIYKLLPDYKEDDNIELGIFGINPLEGLATYSDISFAKGADAVKDIVTSDEKEWELFTNAAGSISESGTKMTGNGKTHIVTPQTEQSDCSVIYGIATSMPQMLTTDIVLENTTGALTNGISISYNGQSVQFYTFGSKNYIRIQLNNAWGTPVYYSYPADVTTIYDADGTCHVTAIVKDGTFYLLCGDNVAYKAQMNILFPGYTNDKAVRLGVCTWDSKNGVSSFENVAFSAGESVTVDSSISYKTIQLLIKSVNGSISHDKEKGDEISITGSSKRPSMLLNGESTIWEVSGTMERTDTNYGTKLFAGFMVEQGGKSLAIKACNKGLYFDVEKSSHSNKYDFNANLKDSTNDYVLNTLTTTIFWDQYKSGNDKDVTFKAVIYEDTLYVWFDGVPSWRIDLTEDIPNRNGNTMREGYTAGEPYSFGFAVHEHNTTVKYKDLTIKTSDEDNSIKTAVEEFNQTVGN